MKILAIIPAKTDSKRLPKKNLQKIKGKTLVEYSIDYAKESFYKPDIIISSEDSKLEEIAKDNNVEYIFRSKDLCGETEVVDVYINVLRKLAQIENRTYDYIVCLQPDHPDREHTFDYCVDYLIDNNYDDLITIEPSFKRSGSVRIFKYDHLMNGYVSKRIGCIKDDATDIHYQEDLIIATNKIKKGK